MRNAWGSSDDTPTGDSKMIVRIKTLDLNPLPHSTKLAKQIRDNILRDEFDYNDAEIAEFNIKYPNDVVIGIKGDSVVKWADDFQVKSWRAGKDNLVPITLTDVWIKAVRNFRDQKILIAIDQAAGAVTDAELQRRFIDDVNKILKLSGKERRDALMDLMTSASGSLAAKKEILQALSYLAAQGYEDNPMLQIARAKASSTGGNDAEVSVFLNNALKITSAGYSSSSQKSISNLNSEDAAYINREAAYMFAQMGNDKEFQNRDWLARIYVMTDAERESVREGEPLHFTAPGPAAMSTPRPLTDAEKLHDSNENNWQLTQEKWGESSKATAEIETTDPRATDRTEIVPKTTITTKIEGSSYPNQQKRDAFPRGQNQKNPTPGKISVTTNGARINPASIESANRWGGGVDLLNKWQNAVTFRIRIEIVTNYIAERDRLERKIAAERVTVVPPKPEEIEKMIADVRQYGRTGGQFEKQEAMRIMPKLMQIRERSYAMWKTKN